MTPTIIKVRKKLILNRLEANSRLKNLNNYSDEEVKLIYSVYSELSNDQIERLIHKLDDIGIEDLADEFKLILGGLLIAGKEADSLISRRISSITYRIPDYLISNDQDRDDVIKWALYNISDEFIINELWRRLVK